MTTLLVLKEAVKGESKALTIAKDKCNINSVMICKGGIKGQINKSGQFFCNHDIAKEIKIKSDEINECLSNHFGIDFKLK